MADKVKVPPARLCESADRSVYVEFRLVPEKIKVSHSSDTDAVKRTLGIPVKPPAKDGGSGAGANSSVVLATDGNPVTVDPGDTILSFSDLVLDGKYTLPYARQLVQWTHPVVKGPQGTPMEVPLLEFSWASFSLGDPYVPLKLALTKVDVEYLRFTDQGVPTRANVSLGCKVKVQAPGNQNPTSGGEPDRSGRRVTAGENIQGIAREHYGDPRRWREVADRNGVDDPLRLRAGDVLYLPGPAELGRVAR